MKKFDVFLNKFTQDIFLQKYSMNGQESWADTCRRVVSFVCGQLLNSSDQEKIYKLMVERKFIPGGRYLYATGRPFHQVNNCFLFRAEDSREGWADLMSKSTSALKVGINLFHFRACIHKNCVRGIFIVCSRNQANSLPSVFTICTPLRTLYLCRQESTIHREGIHNNKKPISFRNPDDKYKLKIKSRGCNRLCQPFRKVPKYCCKPNKCAKHAIAVSLSCDQCVSRAFGLVR